MDQIVTVVGILVIAGWTLSVATIMWSFSQDPSLTDLIKSIG